MPSLAAGNHVVVTRAFPDLVPFPFPSASHEGVRRSIRNAKERLIDHHAVGGVGGWEEGVCVFETDQ